MARLKMNGNSQKKEKVKRIHPQDNETESPGLNKTPSVLSDETQLWNNPLPPQNYRLTRKPVNSG